MNGGDFWKAAEGLVERARESVGGGADADFIKESLKRLEEVLAKASPLTKDRVILGLALQPLAEACATPDVPAGVVDAMRTVAAGMVNQAIELATLSESMEEAGV